ncbi:MAG TPA: tetraacyldisaccharide 4'-kinase [Bacteroidales bacterium]|nr:tetraacyldisaccharide 4'-kinase [Bacteroidales bacterium]
MRLILYPFSLIFKFILIIRHLLYDVGLLKSKSYDIPVIGVGNLSFGGTGKTPTVEYLVNLLSPHYRTAILSRGYKRKRKGPFLLDAATTAADAGDEPRQYKLKFTELNIAVAENRNDGMKLLLDIDPAPEVILLDDAFQHRAIKPGLNILLTDYHKLYPKDHLFPAGNLRDIKQAATRADIIIVTKTPSIISPYIKAEILQIIKPKPHQQLYFAYLEFGKAYPIGKPPKAKELRDVSSIFLVTGIANPYPLLEHMRRKCNELLHKSFSDHHRFSEKDILEIRHAFQHIIGSNKIIVTTEKDAVRLADSPYFSKLEDLPILVQPIRMAFHASEYGSFDQSILNYVRKTSANR